MQTISSIRVSRTQWILTCFVALLLAASTVSASVIATWTFETSQPGVVDLPASPGAGVWITNITAETGSGTAAGLHAAASTYSSPAGNASSHSFSSTAWGVGDCYQFAVSTVGLTHIIVSFDSTSSGTGPANFNLAYSTDGVNFTVFGGYTNGVISFSAGSAATNVSHTFDLGTVAALNNAPLVYFRLVDSSTTSANGGTVASGGTSRVDNFSVSGSSGQAPQIAGVTPGSATTNAGSSVNFTVSLSAGDPPLSYFWYKNSVNPGNLIANATNATLTLANVTAADSGDYYVVVSNGNPPTVTGGPVTLTVTDPAILAQPDPNQSLLSGSTASFHVIASGTPTLTYRWCTGDPVLADNNFTPVPEGGRISGTTTANLVISNLAAGDATSGAVNNYFCIVSNSLGTLVTTPVNLSIVTTSGTLAFYDFNGSFDTNAPVPAAGSGHAGIANALPFALPPGTAQDNNDFVPENVPPISIANLGWGTDAYPAAADSNLTAGVQFYVSTVGAKNIKVSYDVRETATATKYMRLQYTTNGVDFTNYPAPIIFPSISASKFITVPTIDLTGFAGVANNPNFGVRLVSEFISTATYGANPTNGYVNLASSASGYNPSGTVSYDLISITGDAIVGPYNPPVLTGIANQTISDTGGNLNLPVPVTGGTPPLTVSAVSYDTTIANVSPNGTAISVTSAGADGKTPILVTVTDANGNSAATYFFVTAVPNNTAPVVTGLGNTNTLANKPITLNFSISDDHTPGNGQTFGVSVTSSNSTVLASSVIGGSGTNFTLTLTPVADQLGVVPITVNVNDNDPNAPKTATVNFALVVRPSTNVVLDDYFTYNGTGSIITNSGGFWQSHSGTLGQMQVGNGILTVDSVDNSEDVNAPLIGGPFPTNTSGVLYSSYNVKFTTLPNATGAYISHFKDNTTFGFLCRPWSSISNAATGFYRMGIGNSGEASAASPQFPMDLAQGSNYFVVTKLVLSNGFSSLWINPTGEQSTHVDNTTVITNLVAISTYAFRESNVAGGNAQVSNLRVGTSFASVADVLSVINSGTNTVVSWDNVTLKLQSSTNAAGPYVNVPGATSPYTVSSGNGNQFFRLGH